MNRLLFDNDQNQEPFGGDETLKVTALIYLEEAVTKEEYEQCADLVKQAKVLGATPLEVKAVLAAAAGVGKRLPKKVTTVKRF